MSGNTEPIWSAAEQLANKLQVIEILTSLFPRLNLDAELEVVEVGVLMNHVSQLVSSAHCDALAIMGRARRELFGGEQ